MTARMLHHVRLGGSPVTTSKLNQFLVLVLALNSDLHTCLVWNTVDLTHTAAQGMEKPELNGLFSINGKNP